MDKWMESTVFWVVVGLAAAIAVAAINFLMRRVTDQEVGDPLKNPHRIANQLPRELHVPGRDEVLELEDDAGVKNGPGGKGD